MSNKKHIRYIITAALIAAGYVGLTFLSNAFGLAYGPIQLRLSEILTLLPIFTPAAVPGVAIGCFIANIASFNPIDMLFGTAATLAAAILTYCLRKVKTFGLPLLSMLPPVILNAVIIGFEIAWLYLPEGFTMLGMVISAAEVGLGEIIVCIIFGIPFYLAVKRCRVFENQ